MIRVLEGDRLDFIDQIRAAKNAFVMPFVSAPGYDVFDQTELPGI